MQLELIQIFDLFFCRSFSLYNGFARWVSFDETIINGTYTETDFKMPIWKIVLSPILCFGSSQATTGIAIILIIIFIEHLDVQL